MEDWKTYIYSKRPFLEKAVKVFEYQFDNNMVYQRFCIALHNVTLSTSSKIEDDYGNFLTDKIKEGYLSRAQQNMNAIPLFPIQGFKDANLLCTPDQDPELVFQSSGTSGMRRSRHPVADAGLYRKSIMKGFRQFYNLDDAVVFAYTPGYLLNPNSSLVWMLNELIKQDTSGLSRFLPLNQPLNASEVQEIAETGKQLILFGAAFGLLDLADLSDLALPSNSIVIETGGMKTYKREMERMEMHRKLSAAFSLEPNNIHSEYGMAEMLSQAYATGGKWFRSVPWMQVSIRNPDDPAERQPAFSEGLIGVADLANVHSCSFILTGDKGIMDKKGRFQVLGRWNPKDLRGCNFLVDRD